VAEFKLRTVFAENEFFPGSAAIIIHRLRIEDSAQTVGGGSDFSWANVSFFGSAQDSTGVYLVPDSSGYIQGCLKFWGTPDVASSGKQIRAALAYVSDGEVGSLPKGLDFFLNVPDHCNCAAAGVCAPQPQELTFFSDGLAGWGELAVRPGTVGQPFLSTVHFKVKPDFDENRVVAVVFDGWDGQGTDWLTASLKSANECDEGNVLTPCGGVIAGCVSFSGEPTQKNCALPLKLRFNVFTTHPEGDARLRQALSANEFVFVVDDPSNPCGVSRAGSDLPLVRLYPNPADEYVHLQPASYSMLVKIVSFDGRTVWEGHPENGRINVGQLVPGVYGLMLAPNDKYQSFIFIKR
jgi:hypothetical protein